MQVPLGILLKNKYNEMIQIMQQVQNYAPVRRQGVEQHIPSIDTTEVIQQDIFHTALFGGDQLTVA